MTFAVWEKGKTMSDYKEFNNEGFVTIVLTDEEWLAMQNATSDAFEDGHDISWYRRALAHCDVMCDIGIKRAIHKMWDAERKDNG